MITIPKDRVAELNDSQLVKLFEMTKRLKALEKAQSVVAVLKPQVDEDLVLWRRWLGEGEADGS